MALSNTSAPIDFNTAATQTVVAAVAGKRVVVTAWFTVNGVATAQSIQFKSGSNNLTGVMQLPLTIGAVLNDAAPSETADVFFTDVGVALTMVMSAATQVGGYVSYRYL